MIIGSDIIDIFHGLTNFSAEIDDVPPNLHTIIITGSSRLMQISLLRISLLRFFKTITKIWLMQFYGLFILLVRT